MDEREESTEPVEDLEVRAGEAEEVKGGAGTFTLTFQGQTTSPQASDPKELKRGGWDGNHNEALVAL